MSNSAFTPTQIEVTNNVPVNVPVVTAWEDVSNPPLPTGLGSGSGTWIYYKTRRVGSNLEISARFNKDGTAGTGTTNVAFSLPYSNITIDSSINTAGFALSYLVGGQAGYRIIGLSRSTSTSFVFEKDGGADAIKGSDMASNSQIRFVALIPITEWFSGTTTLATRAVEEYAFNTSTSTTTSDFTSFGYGPNGAVIQNITANLARRVQFQSNILSTDKIVVEVSADRVTWIPVGGLLNGQVVDSFRFDGTNLCGIGINATPGFLNQVDVQFGIRRTTGGDWSGVISGYYWRARKVSSGAQVGYPVSARNIVGDTSGSVVPTGMLGETYRVSVSGSAPNLTTVNLATVALPAGVWSVTFCGYFNVNNAILHQQIVSISLTSASNDGNFQSILQGNTTTAEKQVSLTRIVNTTGQNLFLTWYQNGSASTSISGYIVYTRIA